MNYDLINNKIYMFIHIIKILTGMYKYFIIKRIQSDQQLFTCIYILMPLMIYYHKFKESKYKNK